jgi:hypothetical protein
MSISLIKPHLSHFSEQLKAEENMKDVIVAGKIKNVIEGIFEDEVMVVIDDYVGTITLFLSLECYEEYRFLLQKDSFVSCAGILSLFKHKVKTAEHINVIVHGYKIERIKED